MVQTVPSELVQVPASAAGPEGVVAQAWSKSTATPARTIRAINCVFMRRILTDASRDSSAEIDFL
jgi:hypothetical protein